MIANLWALIKVVPMFKSAFDQLVELKINEDINKIDARRISLNDEYSFIYSQISKASSNEERKIFSLSLHRINNDILREHS